jgi:hypothetical protein
MKIEILRADVSSQASPDIPTQTINTYLNDIDDGKLRYKDDNNTVTKQTIRDDIQGEVVAAAAAEARAAAAGAAPTIPRPRSKLNDSSSEVVTADQSQIVSSDLCNLLIAPHLTSKERLEVFCNIAGVTQDNIQPQGIQPEHIKNVFEKMIKYDTQPSIAIGFLKVISHEMINNDNDLKTLLDNSIHVYEVNAQPEQRVEAKNEAIAKIKEALINKQAVPLFFRSGPLDVVGHYTSGLLKAEDNNQYSLTFSDSRIEHDMVCSFDSKNLHEVLNNLFEKNPFEKIEITDASGKFILTLSRP